MSDSHRFILATINAKYSHCAFGLRYLLANLKEFEKDTKLEEFSGDFSIYEIAEKIIAQKPQIVGFSCYIWNIEDIIKISNIIKSVAPEIVIIFGGPEVSYEYEEFLPHCDYLISGEGEIVLYELIKKISQNNPPDEKVIFGGKICDINELTTPYHLYTDEDIKNRLIYVEASRGCPFFCEFCLSSLSKGVREFDLDKFLSSMEILVQRGVKHFKFIDRTFNIKFARVKTILEFFKARWADDMMLHFEVFPDKLTDEMLEEIKNFPKGGLHLEAGVQSFYEPSLKAISRRQNEEKTLKNLDFITNSTGAIIHSDLVAGLPYSTIQTFAIDFDKIMQSNPEELQVGILKRLRGAPIDRHTIECEMIYSKIPPYEILQNKDMSYQDLQNIKRFARYFDVFYNSGKFVQTMKLLLNIKKTKYESFMDFTKYIWQKYQQTHKISINRQTQILFEYLSEYISEDILAKEIFSDYKNTSRKDNIEYIKTILIKIGEKF